jgi:copper chaperone
MQAELIKVTGMTCGGCTSSVTEVLKAINGVDDVKVSLSNGEATVQYDEQLTSPEQLKSAVKVAGYGIGDVNTKKWGFGRESASIDD